MAHGNFWSALTVLVLVLDPFGNLPVYLAMMRPVPPHRRLIVTLRESAIAFGVLLAFMFGGQHFLAALGLEQAALAVAGGVILLLVAIKMIFASSETMFGEIQDGEPLIFPLAVPLLAGPSSLATVLLLSSGQPGQLWTWIGALSAASALTCGLLLAADRLLRLLGEPMLRALEKLMGLIVAAIAVNMMLGGVKAYFFGA